MRASPQHQLQLLELAKLDAARVRLQHTAKNLPEQRHLVELEQQRHHNRARTAEALGELEDARTQLQRVESDVDTVVQRLHHDERQLEHAATAKEIAGYEAEIASLRRRRERLEDEQLALDGTVEELSRAYEQRRETMQELEALAADLLERRELAKRNLQVEAKELASARATLVKGIPNDLYARYEQLRERSGVGAAELVGTVSMASNETLELVDLERIRKAAADEVVFCPSTGAILVRTTRSDV